MEKANHTVRTLCRVLSVSRAAYYDWVAMRPRSRRAVEDQALLVHLRAVHRRSRGTYGSRRVWHALRAEGLEVGLRRVARLMREHDLQGLPKVRFRGGTTDSSHEELILALFRR